MAARAKRGFLDSSTSIWIPLGLTRQKVQWVQTIYFEKLSLRSRTIPRLFGVDPAGKSRSLAVRSAHNLIELSQFTD